MSGIQTGIQTGGLASQINRDAKHWLLVEGDNDAAFDPTVLRALLVANGLSAVNVAPLGSCENMHQAAKAMFYRHPDYYFIIDRDGRSDPFVDRSWELFPDPNSFNLLVWKKHELENYFIDPVYLLKSEFLIKSESELSSLILRECQKRVYLDAVILTLLELREQLIQPPKASFRNPDEFQDATSALSKLQACVGLCDKLTESTTLLSAAHRKERFEYWLHRLTGGKSVLEYGSGDWLSLMTGKEIFNTIANQIFQVRGSDNQLLAGKQKNIAVARKLLALPLTDQPVDFQNLVNLIQQRLISSPN